MDFISKCFILIWLIGFLFVLGCVVRAVVLDRPIRVAPGPLESDHHLVFMDEVSER